jgi:hypothetical protein
MAKPCFFAAMVNLARLCIISIMRTTGAFALAIGSIAGA